MSKIEMANERPEPESYSLDEMMQRLRSRGIESEPELIIRPDGSQVYRVRKRKRRTRQPHKEEQRRLQRTRVFQIGALVIMVMLLVTGVVGVFGYYNSRTFATKLARRVADWTGAQTEFSQFRITPVRATVAGALLRWPDQSPLGELQLANVSADLRVTSFLTGRWNGEEVLAASGSLRLGPPAADAGKPAAVPGSLDAMPFSFIRYRCEKLGVQFGTGAAPSMQCRDVEASFYLVQDGGQVRLNGGRITAAGWPDLPLERGLIEFRGGRVVVSSLSLSSGIDEEGFADITGSVDPRSRQPMFLDVRFERFPFQLLGGPKAAQIFNARLDSSATLSFVPGRFESHELVAPFEASAATNGVFVGGFPFLQILRNEFQDEDFGSRWFSTETKGTLRRSAAAVKLEDLRLAEKNFLALRGELRISRDERLEGSFEVGVAERLAGRHPSPVFRRLFEREEDGFRWTKLKLSGTIGRPEDDFAERVRVAKEAAGGGAAAEMLTPADVLEKKFHDLMRDPAAPSKEPSR